MNTADLAERVATEHGVAKDHAKKIIDSTFAVITTAGRAGDAARDEQRRQQLHWHPHAPLISIPVLWPAPWTMTFDHKPHVWQGSWIGM